MVGWAVGLTLSLVVIHAVFFGEDRYHLVLSPLLAVLAAGWGVAPEVPAAAAVA